MAAKRKRRRKASAAAPRRRRRRSTRRNPGVLANPRRRRRSTRRRSTTRRRRVTVRRNPSLGGIVKVVTRGVKDAGVMVAGEMASNIIAGQIPTLFKDDPEMDSNVKKVIAAAGVGVLAQMIFKGGDIARIAVAGALSAPIRDVVRKQLPTTGILSGALSSYPFTSFAPMAAYPMLPRLQGYPVRRNLGCADEQTQAAQIFQTGAY